MNYKTEKLESEKFFQEALDLLMSKANDYASDIDCLSNFNKIANICDIPIEKVFLMFLTVKIARLVELLSKPNKNESKKDSLLDIANYACLYSLFLKEPEGVI